MVIKRKIGLIGIGDIALKAYLPVYLKQRSDCDFYVCSRDITRAKKIRDDYQLAGAVDSVENLIAEGIELAFVHNVMTAHFETCRVLLQAGIHVFVDKPLGINLKEVQTLYELAKTNQVYLMVGLNRRWAPLINEVKTKTDMAHIRILKTRISDQQLTREAIFDQFIHVLDTLIYLFNQDTFDFEAQVIEDEENHLKYIEVKLCTGEKTATGQMNFQANTNREVVECQSREGIFEIINLSEMKIYHQTEEVIQVQNDWQTLSERKGFSQMVTAFLKATANHTDNPSQVEKAIRQKDVIRSHELCERLSNSSHF